MIKDLPAEPLEFTLEDETRDSDESYAQTYTLPVKSGEITDLTAELSLGDPIESAPIITPGENLYFTEEDDEELVITGIPVKSTARTELTLDLAFETAEIINQIQETSSSNLSTSIEESHSNELQEELVEEFVAEASAPVATTTKITEVKVSTQQNPATNSTSKKNLKKKKNSTDVFVNLVVGVVILSLIGILVVINLFLFGNSTENHESELTKFISNSANNLTANPANRDANKSNKEVAASIIKIGEISSNNLSSGEYKFVYNLSTNIGSFQFKGSTEKPLPLSAEEVGRKVQAPSWLKTIETQAYSFKDLKSESKQTFNIPTRFYFETNGISTRAVGPTEVTIMRDKADNITLDYIINIPKSNKLILDKESISGRITFSF